MNNIVQEDDDNGAAELCFGLLKFAFREVVVGWKVCCFDFDF